MIIHGVLQKKERTINMNQEWLDKIKKYEEEMNNPEIAIEELDIDYETWCYAVGKAWSIMRWIYPKIFAGLPEGAVMLTERHTPEDFEKLIRKYYPRINNRLMNDKKEYGSKIKDHNECVHGL